MEGRQLRADGTATGSSPCGLEFKRGRSGCFAARGRPHTQRTHGWGAQGADVMVEGKTLLVLLFLGALPASSKGPQPAEEGFVGGCKTRASALLEPH